MSTKIPLSAMVGYYTPELREFLETLGKIAAGINPVEMLTPVNANAEKEKFKAQALRGQYEDPIFQYDAELLGKVAKLWGEMMQLRPRMMQVLDGLSTEEPGRVLAEMTKERYFEAYCLTRVATDLLAGDYRAASWDLETIFGFPSEKTIQKAYESMVVLADGTDTFCYDSPGQSVKRKALKALEFDATQIRENFIWAAEHLGIAGSRPVEIDPLATAIDVRDKSSRGAVVVIPETRKVDGVKLVELTGHEICCHWGDSTRAGIVLPLLGSGALKPADEMLYEGHAVMADVNTKKDLGENAPLHQKPWYILAMDLAKLGMRFGQMARRLYDFVRPTVKSDEKAWNTVWTVCYRVKRGSSGSDCSFIFTKDRAYYEGRMLAEKLCIDGLGNALDIATISVADLELLKPIIDFGAEDFGHMRSIRELQARMIDKLLAE